MGKAKPIHIDEWQVTAYLQGSPALANCPSQRVNTNVSPLPEMFKRYRARINTALRHSLSNDTSQVYDMLRYYMGWVNVDGTPCTATEGKALRPTLCLFACESVGGHIDRAMPVAIALEFIHNFSLIHDDIQDGDETRHHRPTLWTIWGRPKALVAGNVLRVTADTCLTELVDQGLKTNQALIVTSLLTEAYLEMIEGQYLDLSYEGRPDVSLNDYLNMISRKTCTLIRCALQVGAIMGTDNSPTIAAFRACGMSLGYAFQIRDDVLGVWGNEEVTGKPVGADILRKKNSFPIMWAKSKACEQDKRLLTEIYCKDQLDHEDVSTILALMQHLNVKEHAENLIEGYCTQSLQALESIKPTSLAKQQMEELAHFLLVRQH